MVGKIVIEFNLGTASINVKCPELPVMGIALLLAQALTQCLFHAQQERALLVNPLGTGLQSKDKTS